MASPFRQLLAYRLATKLAGWLYWEVATWEPFDRWSVGMQLVRAADSVGANIAEATGRWSVPDKRRLLLVARGSLHETEHWIGVAEGRRLLATGTST